MTACLFKVETDAGWVVGMYPSKAVAKEVRNGFPIHSYGYTESGLLTDTKVIRYGATVCRGPAHKLGETGQARHHVQGSYWVQSTASGMPYHRETGDMPTSGRQPVGGYTYFMTGRIRSGEPLTNPCSETEPIGASRLTNIYVNGVDVLNRTDEEIEGVRGQLRLDRDARPVRITPIGPLSEGIHPPFEELPLPIEIELERNPLRPQRDDDPAHIRVVRPAIEIAAERVVARNEAEVRRAMIEGSYEPVIAPIVHPMCRSVVPQNDSERRSRYPVDRLADSADLSDEERRHLHEFAERSRRRTW